MANARRKLIVSWRDQTLSLLEFKRRHSHVLCVYDKARVSWLEEMVKRP